jgi:hypothetical protein
MDNFSGPVAVADWAPWFGWRNLIFGPGGTEAWSVYRIRMDTAERVPALHSPWVRTEELFERIETDFSLLRVARAWSLEDYAMGFEAVADVRHANRDVLSSYVQAQSAAIDGLAAQTIDVFLCVRLARPPSGLSGDAALDWLVDAEVPVFHRVRDCSDVTRTNDRELARLVHDAFRRGLPQDADHASVGYEFGPYLGLTAADPDPTELLDHVTASVRLAGRSVEVDSDVGTSYQSFLRVESLGLPTAGLNHRVEQLFALLDDTGFPVHAALSVYRADEGEHVTALRAARLARSSNRATGQASRRRVALSLVVGAASTSELERRVVRLRRELVGVRLRRSASEQISLFCQHLPRRGYGHTVASAGLTVDQLGAFTVANSALGSPSGPYLGHTASASPRPVLFDPFEGAKTGAPIATLVSGAAGSGKTLCMELIMYQAFVAGAAVIDVDAHGDHALEHLPDVAPRAHVLELSAVAQFRGLLDPLRSAPPGTRERLATEFLIGVLPQPVSPRRQREIAASVQAVAKRTHCCCAEVVAELTRHGPEARAAADAIEASVATGLPALGFASDHRAQEPPEPSQLTTLRLRDLAVSTSTSDPTANGEEERIGRLIVRLLSAYALRLASSHHRRQCVLGLDGPSILSDRSGRALVDRIAAGARVGGFTPLIATAELEDGAWLARRFGASLCFRVRDARQARNVAQLLRSDDYSERLARRLLDARPGECVMRDYGGRVGAVQVEFVDDRLLPTLDTTPVGMPVVR